MDGLQVSPTTSDSLRVTGAFYRLIRVIPHTYGAEVLFYEIHGQRI